MYIYISYIKCIATTGAIVQLPAVERCGEAAAGGGSTCLTLQVFIYRYIYLYLHHIDLSIYLSVHLYVYVYTCIYTFHTLNV